jgi:endonuclease-3 related protein
MTAGCRSHAGAIAIMPTFEHAFPAVCAALVEQFGGSDQEFAGLAPFEAMVAVLLERELGSTRLPRALDALNKACLLTPARLDQADIPEIGDALRESGISASSGAIAPLKQLARWLVNHHGGRVDPLFDPHRSTDWLRGELAAIKGIGPAAADAMILHGMKRPSYPVDRATYRVLVRHGWLDSTETYQEVRDLVVDLAVDRAEPPGDDPADLLRDLAAGMEQVGRRYCRTAMPHCEGCPLESFLPEGGPREVDG